MARQLGYTPPAPPDSQARAELDDLVEALHEAGLLRALAGGARAYPDILRLLLESVEARSAAPQAARGRPPGLLRLAWRLRRRNTRRGLAASIAALAALGSALGEDEPSGPDVRHPS